MEYALLWIGIIIIIATFISKVGNKIGIPIPLIFLGLGLLLGNDGLNFINLQNYSFVQDISSFALIFIMFYGGFGVNMDSAKPIVKHAVILSSLGTIITALVICLFTTYVLGFTLIQGFLIGAVISSTDAASVFSILKGKQLSLRNKLDSLLEIESGSNDPFSYMLTLLGISLYNSENINIPIFLLQQIIVGILVAVILSYLFAYILSHIELELDGLYSIFILGVILLVYTLSQSLGGNGFISVYLAGIILNNSKRMPYKRSLVHFFDGISWLMQMVLFLSLGLLANPSEFGAIISTAVLIALVTIFIARPLAIYLLMWRSKYTKWEKLFISIAGIRGAASIVFSTFVLSLNDVFARDVFNIVFFLVIISVLLQGGLMPMVAKRFDLIDDEESIAKTFSDYENEVDANLAEITIDTMHPWVERPISELNTSTSMLVIMIKRNNKTIIPSGDTVIRDKDILTLAYEKEEEIIALQDSVA